jgi:hypothetical protein
MTKEQLKRYRERKLELQDINAGISNSTIHDSVSGSKKEFPWTIGTRHVEGVPDEDYGLLVRKSNLKAQIKEIEDFVNSIPNYHLKKAVCIYYINDVESGEDKPTWEDVAEEIGNGFTSKKLEVQLGRYIKSYNSFQKSVTNVTNVTHVTNRHAIIIIRNDINYRFLVAVSFIFYTPCLTLLSELWSDWQERKIYLDISGDINVYSSANQTHDKYRQSAYVLQ